MLQVVDIVPGGTYGFISFNLQHSLELHVFVDETPAWTPIFLFVYDLFDTNCITLQNDSMERCQLFCVIVAEFIRINNVKSVLKLRLRL